MDISVIIVNYNTYALTVSCVSSVIRHTQGLAYEIIVVDNASAHFDAAGFRQAFPDATLIVLEQNLGFAGGNNAGIRAASGKYLLLLNSDTYLEDNALLQLFRFMEQHPQAGVVAPRLIYPDGRHQSVAQRFPSVKYGLLELLRIQKLLGKRQAGRLLLGAFFDHKETVTADWVWGAAFMLRSEIIRQLPGRKLDDTYFMYWEDVQWCMDIRKLGYQVCYFAGTQIVHIHEGSKGPKNELMIKNAELFFKRNYSALSAAVIKFINTCLGN